MILLDDYEVFDREDLNSALKYLESLALTKEEKEFFEFTKKHLEEVFEQNLKLQEMVSEKISEDLISVVILPIDPEGNLDEFNFGLINVEGEQVSKRDELLYHNLCDVCFGHVPGLISRAIIELG